MDVWVVCRELGQGRVWDIYFPSRPTHVSSMHAGAFRLFGAPASQRWNMGQMFGHAKMMQRKLGLLNIR